MIDAADLAAATRDLELAGAELVHASIGGSLTNEGPAKLSPAQLRFLWEQLGYERDSALTRALVERGIAPLAGGATGLQATAYMNNLPPEGTAVYNGDAFARETERNDLPLEQKAFSGLGAPPIDLRIPNIGVQASMLITVKGTLTVSGSGTVTAGYQWPWNLLKRFSLNLQGQTGLHSVEGLDLRARRQRVYRNPKEDVSTAPAMEAATGNPQPGVIANGSYPVVLEYAVPIAHDMWTLTGSIYAQSDAVYLNWRIQPAAVAELFSVAAGGAVSFTGTIDTTLTYFDIPYQDVSGKGRVVLLPELRWLHALQAADKQFANTGDVDNELIRNAGQLVAAMEYIDNGGLAQIDPSVLESVIFGYGGNRKPREFRPVTALLGKNALDYNGRIRPGFLVLDFEADNPAREVVYPKGVTELKITNRIPAGTTINANARIHTVYETLFSGAGA
ncbi:MAG TPA: hypothetical protein VFR97_04975 [Capillimicrobium sp.]|nr:hypothetical protein [Capillimicrobium sp.]